MVPQEGEMGERASAVHGGGNISDDEEAVHVASWPVAEHQHCRQSSMYEGSALSA